MPAEQEKIFTPQIDLGKDLGLTETGASILSKAQGQIDARLYMQAKNHPEQFNLPDPDEYYQGLPWQLRKFVERLNGASTQLNTYGVEANTFSGLTTNCDGGRGDFDIVAYPQTVWEIDGINVASLDRGRYYTEKRRDSSNFPSGLIQVALSMPGDFGHSGEDPYVRIGCRQRFLYWAGELPFVLWTYSTAAGVSFNDLENEQEYLLTASKYRAHSMYFNEDGRPENSDLLVHGFEANFDRRPDVRGITCEKHVIPNDRITAVLFDLTKRKGVQLAERLENKGYDFSGFRQPSGEYRISVNMAKSIVL